MITVYTDGACIGNPGPGGWAWCTTPTEVYSGGELHSTNNRMELMACIQALEFFEQHDVEVFSDSKYVVDCFEKKWYTKWASNGWKTSKGSPVLNEELWRRLLRAVSLCSSVKWNWVKGHSGVPLNEVADLHATKAAATILRLAQSQDEELKSK